MSLVPAAPIEVRGACSSLLCDADGSNEEPLELVSRRQQQWPPRAVARANLN
jgi:hypothetical protein